MSWQDVAAIGGVLVTALVAFAEHGARIESDAQHVETARILSAIVVEQHERCRP